MRSSRRAGILAVSNGSFVSGRGWVKAKKSYDAYICILVSVEVRDRLLRSSPPLAALPPSGFHSGIRYSMQDRLATRAVAQV